MSKTWLITGAARGFGLQIVQAALSAGDQVIATARDTERLERALGHRPDRLQLSQLDITDADAATAVVSDGVKRFGGIDVLVNNAGYGLAGAFEELSPTDVEAQFQTNVFGTFNVTRAVLPTMRAQRSGLILNISSLLGIVGTDWWSVYCAAKFALAGWSESLSRELAPFGIHVTSVHPGQFNTDFLDPSSMGMGEGRIDDYGMLNNTRRQFVADRNHAQPGDPEAFAAAILHLAALETPPARWAAGTDALDSFEVRARQLRESVAEWGELSASTDRVA